MTKFNGTERRSPENLLTLKEMLQAPQFVWTFIFTFLLGNAGPVAIMAIAGESIADSIYGEKVELRIKAKAIPNADSIKENKRNIIRLENKVNDVNFKADKIILLLEKTTSRQTVKEVDIEMERFRPKRITENNSR